MIFYLGSHEPSWLASEWIARARCRLFISRLRLERRKALPRALVPWALDSGAFTELHRAGRWTLTPGQYAVRVRVFQDAIGLMDWASPQDWLCEPSALKATGLSIERHQVNTVTNLCELRAIAPGLPWVPVLQGWTLADYDRCFELYGRYGVNLLHEPVIGVGSLCRRQGTKETEEILRELWHRGFPCLHGFGLKTKGLLASADKLRSADSMAWSYHARFRPALPGCSHKRCNNCLRYALRWRTHLLGILERRDKRR